MRCYLSHPIQGKKGGDATREDMDVNNQRAMEYAVVLRGAFPSIDFYVPAEHDEVVIELYEQKSITVEQILEADKAIVRKCDFLLALMLDDHLSRGMIKEVIEACDQNIPVFFLVESRGPCQTVDQIVAWLKRRMR